MPSSPYPIKFPIILGHLTVSGNIWRQVTVGCCPSEGVSARHGSRRQVRSELRVCLSVSLLRQSATTADSSSPRYKSSVSAALKSHVVRSSTLTDIGRPDSSKLNPAATRWAIFMFSKVQREDCVLVLRKRDRFSMKSETVPRDLVRFALDVGFTDIHMEFHVDVVPSTVHSWEVFLGSSPHPWAPPLGRILAERFSTEERELFEAIFRPRIEPRQFATADRIAYLTARKPPS